MREYPFALKGHITKGIVPTPGSDQEGLYTCTNARPFSRGMEFVAPYSSYLDLEVVFPFSQLLVTDKYKYVAYATGIYEVVNNALVSRASLALSSHVDLADFKDSVALTGGNKTLIRNAAGALVEVDNVPKANACCSFEGLLVLGNIASWTQSADVGADSIAWASRPRSADFVISVGNVATGAGFSRLFCGTVLKVLNVDKKLVVFGTKGIAVLDLQSAPLPAFGVSKTYKASITYKESIVQSDSQVLFVDSLGFLCSFSVEKGPVVLGFERFFSGPVVGSYNEQDQEVYMSTETDALVITSSGVGRLAQAITSCGWDGSALCVVASTPSSENLELIIDNCNMAIGANKTLYAQEVTGETDGRFEVGAFFKRDASSSYLNAGYSSCGPGGVGTKIVEGSSFRPKIRVIEPEHAKVFDYNLRWKLTDKRSVRGYYDNKTSA